MSSLTPDEIRTMRSASMRDGAGVFWAVADEVCDFYGIKSSALLRRDRKDGSAVMARKFACLYAHRRGVSTAAIGRFLGRDHTTILHNIESAEAMEQKAKAEGKTA